MIGIYDLRRKMKYKDILDRTRLVEDILGGTVCLAIVKNNLGDGIVEVAESRELSIFHWAK